MNIAVQDGEKAGEVPLKRGHLSCVRKEEKEFSKQRRLLVSWAKGTEVWKYVGCPEKQSENKGNDGKVSGLRLESSVGGDFP